jgi:hypothetical protein
MRERLRQWRHRVSHWLGWNEGDVVVWPDGKGGYRVGFRCDVCGKVDGEDDCFPIDRESHE